MPHLRFREIDESIVSQLSLELPPLLAPVMTTSEDNFTFEKIETVFYSFGRQQKSYPFVEVLWFQRSQEVQNETANIISQKVQMLTGQADVVVVFIPIPKNSYYENGNHF